MMSLHQDLFRKSTRNLLQGYQYDIAHYATAGEKVKAEKCYLSLAKQLLDKENHKFQYKEIEHGGRAQKYYSSVEWLLRADMVQLCKLVILERGTNGWIISNRSTKLPTYRYRMHRYTGKS